MRKLIILLLISAMLLTPALAVETLHDDAITVPAPSAVLMEKTTGEVIYEKNSHERRSPASVTKVMTMLLIVEELDAGRMTLEDKVIASRRASSMGGSQIWLEEGEQLTVDEMLKCISVVSANDCAVAMAEHISGSEEAFVQKMNQRAWELGMEDTHFTNCTGLFDDPEHYTTAYDIALMSRELISHDLIKDYTTIWMDSIRDGAFGLSNTNKLVRYYDGATGLKTGFTSTAMYCLAATAERDGVEYIAAIMHAATKEERTETATALLNYAFANYTVMSLEPENGLAPVPVELGNADSVMPECAGGAVLIEKARAGAVSQELELPESIAAPVEKGQVLGTLTVKSGSEVIAEIPLTASEAVEQVSVFTIFGRMLKMIAGG